MGRSAIWARSGSQGLSALSGELVAGPAPGGAFRTSHHPRFCKWPNVQGLKNSHPGGTQVRKESRGERESSYLGDGRPWRRRSPEEIRELLGRVRAVRPYAAEGRTGETGRVSSRASSRSGRAILPGARRGCAIELLGVARTEASRDGGREFGR